ncbi:hypothetical protein N7510_006541 [Penicillium lagena]|uniref:uncharacterized protein n=1 Tax=Penicillium lagena TaxID=94218 RepID=UPI002540553A|nr:uncharacterized protein N7510_006541 [Penicillium lagena]KAJ5613347.1 hypothetical protein N7510_006541 [Penicillium lagena]
MQLFPGLGVFLLATYTASAVGNPLVGPVDIVECLLVEVVVQVLDACSTATQFCESLLAPTITVSTTTTATYSSCDYTYTPQPTTTSAPTSKKSTTPCPTPKALEEFADWQITEACRCLHIPSTDIPTITATKTSTTTTTLCPVPTSCGNEGVQWAYYYFGEGNVLPYHNGGENYMFDVTALKDTTPDATGTTVYVAESGTSYGPTIDIYGTQQTFDYFALNQRGYIYAETTGTYVFTITNIDEVAYSWDNTTAYSGWDESNFEAYTSDNSPTTGNIYSMDLLSGQYFPIRIVSANAQGASNLQISITAPDGSVILGPNSSASPYIVQYSCDGTSAPLYPPFGSET